MPASLTAYNQETLVIPLPRKNQPSRRTDGNNHPLPNPHPAAASSFLSSRQNRQRANRTPQTPNLPPTLHTSAPCLRSKQRQPTRSNLHSLNSSPAVQCNEGFCNAPKVSALP